MKKPSREQLLQSIEKNFMLPLEKGDEILAAELVKHTKQVLKIDLKNPTEKVSYQHFDCLGLLTGIAIERLGYVEAMEITVLYSSILYTLVDLLLKQIDQGMQSDEELEKIYQAIETIINEPVIDIEKAASPAPELAVQSMGIVTSMLALGSFISYKEE
ncbi:hypothetical protein KA111_02670 [Candidatus Woesebacteria bacterium]|nr:hypothetical protein [Candidatus Woesebacteria bacterium]